MADESRLLALSNIANIAFSIGNNKVAAALGQAGQGLSISLAAQKAKAKADAIQKSNEKKTDAVAIPLSVIGAIVGTATGLGPVQGAKMGNTVGKSLASPFTKDPGDGRSKGGSSLDEFLGQEDDPIGNPIDPLAISGGTPRNQKNESRITPSVQFGAGAFSNLTEKDQLEDLRPGLSPTISSKFGPQSL